MSPAPWGFYRRNEPGLRGWLARWWYERRVRVIREHLRQQRER